MLQGTFETLSLPEVLGLLASARKSGALRLEAGPVSGVIHLEDGHCRAVETGEQRAPVEGGAALLGRLVDVCFAVTRQETGAFRFVADEPAPWMSDEPVELSDALVEVDRLLKQWREILRVIPSLDCRPRLLDALEVDELVVDRDRWTLLVAIDGRRTVRELVQRAARPVIDVCHTLLELVEAGAIDVIDPVAALEPVAPEPAPAPPAPAPAVVAASPTPAPVTAPPASPAAVPATPTAPAPIAVVAPAPVQIPAPVPAPGVAASVSVDATGAVRVEERAAAASLAVVPDADADQSETADDGADAPDKGAFLRLFSGLRDS